MANPASRLFGGLLAVYRFLRSCILNLFFLLLLFLLFSPLIPRSPLPVPDSSALTLDLVGSLVEQRSLGSAMDQVLEQAGATQNAGEILLQDVLDAIAGARDDRRITALVLLTDNFAGGGFSQLRDLAAAVQDFRSSGKPVYALGSHFNQAQYYLASTADEILMHPLGMVEMEGFGAWQVYFRDALDKLGVNAHIFRVGEFKAAVEPYERNDMSPEARENYTQLLGELWQLYLDDVAARRNMAAEDISDYISHLDEHLASQAGDGGSLALQLGLVDQLLPRPQSLTWLQERIGANGNSWRSIDYKSYLARTRALEPRTNPNRIALIVASGEIHDGEALTGSIGSQTLAGLIREAREDERLKALVLRIDSPGGTVTGSEEIREELLAYKETGRPLLVSMGNMAASGGYWISTAADQIWATPATITGSIGIFGVVPTFENSLDLLGISVDGVGTTPLSGGATLARPLAPEVARSLQLIVQNGYARFLGIVGEARGMSAEQVDAIGQGRIWSGQAALELGLVDHLGSLEETLDAAARLAGLDSYETNLLGPRLSPLQIFVRDVLQNTNVSALIAGTSFPGADWRLVGELFADLPREPLRLLMVARERSVFAQCLECSLLRP